MNPSTIRRHLARSSVLLWVVLAGAAGCASKASQGYSLQQSLYREGIESVAVPIWQRGADVFRRDIETRLTEAIIKRVQLDTPYKVVDKSKADTVLEGTIVRVDQRVLSFNPRLGTPRDLQIRIVVRFTWTDLRTGEILVEQNNFRAAGVYYPTEPLDEDFFLGSADAIDLLAGRVVEKMEKPW